MPVKRAPWTEESLRAAMTAVERGQMTQRAAALQHNIPRRTLRQHLQSGSCVKILGRGSTINQEQENDLVDRIIRFGNIGLPLTNRNIRRQAFVFCERLKLKHNFNKNTGLAGRDWLSMFVKRHPDLSKRRVQPVKPVRAKKLSESVFREHFKEVNKIYEELDIKNHPERLYNVAEEECRLSVDDSLTVSAQDGAQGVNWSDGIIVAMCVNAIGTTIPPMIIFKRDEQKPEDGSNLPVGSLVRTAQNGCTTTDLFIDFVKHLAKYKTQGKALLIFDGATSTALDYTIIEEAEKHDIVLYCLPINTTHEFQPLEKAVIPSFARHWDRAVATATHGAPEGCSTKLSFDAIFTKVWSRSLTYKNIAEGFAATGLYPFNPNILPGYVFAVPAFADPPQLSAGDGTDRDRLFYLTPERSPNGADSRPFLPEHLHSTSVRNGNILF